MHRVIDYLETNPPQNASLLGVWKRRAGVALFPRTGAPHIHVALSTFMALNECGNAVDEPDPRLVVQANDPGAAHPSLWMDWKDNMAPTMARTMIHILIDELLSAGVSAATIGPRPRTAD